MFLVTIFFSLFFLAFLFSLHLIKRCLILCGRQQGFQNLYTLMGGVSHYLNVEGPRGWIGNLFVFDDRLSLPPSAYNPDADSSATEIVTKAQGGSGNYSFANCYVCGSHVHELRHRNCANLDCNLLFL